MLRRCGAGAIGLDRSPRGRVSSVLPLLGLTLLVVGCGHGSETTGPDTVPEVERADHLQAQKNRVDDPPRLASMRIAEVIALPTFPRAYSRGDLAQISDLEARGVVLTGFVARVRQMDDGDYHLQVTEAPRGTCLD